MWQKIYFNSQNVITETDKAVLIAMPHNSDYDGFSFWHPKKLVRNEGNKGYRLSFSFTEDFQFNLKKNVKGKYNKNEVIDTRQITCDEMTDAFKGKAWQINFCCVIIALSLNKRGRKWEKSQSKLETVR